MQLLSKEKGLVTTTGALYPFSLLRLMLCQGIGNQKHNRNVLKIMGTLAFCLSDMLGLVIRLTPRRPEQGAFSERTSLI